MKCRTVSRLMVGTLGAMVIGTPGTAAPAQPARAEATLVPLPASVQPMSGRYIPDKTITVVLGAGPELRQLRRQAISILGSAWHRPVRVASGPAPRGAIILRIAKDAKADQESYRLAISSSSIHLTGASATGLFYGLQTLRQLAEQGGAAGIAAVAIDDQPRFRWRGLMLDSARHMQTVSYIKSQLDLMARYKFNRFHWHLTDDQGWRIAINRYPRLTKVGAWRDETVLGHQLDPYVGDGKPYGGFYTQAQVRDVVAYAKALHIEVIPEIDIPGHTVAVLAS